MAMKITKRLLNWRIWLVITLAVGVLIATHPAQGCGPFSLRQVFTYQKHPDMPLKKFVAGEVGVLQPSYARSYLVVAYRYFNNAPLGAGEQKAAMAVWDERLQQVWDTPGEDTQKGWFEARAKVTTAAKTDIDMFRTVQQKDLYLNYLNCTPESFKNAAAALNRLIEKYGASSPEAKDWVATQDQVFASCSEAKAAPAPADASASPTIRANRAYQIAAASFYAGNFDQAESQFNTIAKDSASPWHGIAPYLVARTLIRKATLSGGPNAVDKATLTKAQAQLQQVLADKSESALHPSAHGLLNYTRLRLAPEDRLKELSADLLKKNADAAFKQDLIDYTLLLDRLVGDTDDSTDKKKTFAEVPDAVHNDDLSDWALTFQVDDNDATAHAVQQWEKTSSIPWLVAALSKVNAAHPKAAALMEAGAKIKPNSAAYASVMYHILRLSIAGGHQAAARQQLDTLLSANAVSLTPSTFNQFMSLRMKVAANLNEFLKYAQRVPAGFTYDEDGRELPIDSSDAAQPKSIARNKLSWDDDATKMLNEAMPLTVLKDAATNTMLATHLRGELALAVWARAALLDDDVTANEIAPAVAGLIPELKDLLNTYVAATDKQEKKFDAIYLVLKYPGVRPSVNSGTGRTTDIDKIDEFRDNWWCDYGQPVEPDNPMVKRPATSNANGPAFLTAPQKTAASAEWKRLVALGTAPNYLCAQAIKWANLKPDDPRAPEALHLAVRSTRYGCTNDQTGAMSKLAYDLLHRKYPKSDWAQKTKYWFKG